MQLHILDLCKLHFNRSAFDIVTLETAHNQLMYLNPGSVLHFHCRESFCLPTFAFSAAGKPQRRGFLWLQHLLADTLPIAYCRLHVVNIQTANVSLSSNPYSPSLVFCLLAVLLNRTLTVHTSVSSPFFLFCGCLLLQGDKVYLSKGCKLQDCRLFKESSMGAQMLLA